MIGKLFNHSDGSVTAIYDLHTYDTEKKAALGERERKLRNIVREVV